jgi:hypothetical protein
LADFGVERHTLVTGKITKVFHHSSAAVTQVPAAKAHLFRVRAQLLRRLSGSTRPFQGKLRDSPPTQLRGRQGASFAWFLVRFRRRNHLGCTFRTLGVRHFGEDTFRVLERSSVQIRGNPSDPFPSRPERLV